MQTTSDMDGVSVGLVEYGRAFPFRHVAKGTGTLSLGPSEITWRNDEDRDRSFALRPEVIREVTMRCATRGAGTVCLELVVETVTNLEYYFRDPNWSAGQNAGIRQVYDHVRAAYPRITVREQAVDKIK